MSEQGYKQFDDLKCIWMSSNLVEYKLCDRDFDCENCEFDKVMRNQATKMNEKEGNITSYANFFRKLIERLKDDIKFRKPPYYYLKNSLVVKNLFGNIFYIGIDPAALILLDTINSVNYLVNGEKNIQRGFPLIQIQGEWGSIDINSPVNFLLLNKSQYEPLDFLTNEWFGLIEADKEEISEASVNEEEYNQIVNNIGKTLSGSIPAYPETGVTMMDGGHIVHYLYEVMGENKYMKLLKSVFCSV